MPLPAIEQQLFRRVCGKYATGIAVVTVLDAQSIPHGLTVNSFTSVSLDPAMILFCIDRKTGFLNHFLDGARFAVNVLREDQKELSSSFARSGEPRFDGIEWRCGETSAPILAGALASLECAVTQMVEAGDHVVVIGEVSHADWSEGQPLIYFNSSYQTLRSEASAS